MLTWIKRTVQVLDTVAIIAYGIALLRGVTPPVWVTGGLLLLIAASVALQLLVWRRAPGTSQGAQRLR